MSADPNTISDKNYKEMWCRHGFRYDAGTHINREENDSATCRCLGTKCPSLVVTKIEGDEWLGYCGADHPMFAFIKSDPYLPF